MALINMKDINKAFEMMNRILEKLDQIYHVLNDKEN